MNFHLKCKIAVNVKFNLSGWPSYEGGNFNARNDNTVDF